MIEFYNSTTTGSEEKGIRAILTAGFSPASMRNNSFAANTEQSGQQFYTTARHYHAGIMEYFYRPIKDVSIAFT